MRKKYGFEIGVIIALLVLSLILYGFYLIYDTYKTSKSYTLFIEPLTIIDCFNYKCENVTEHLENYNNTDYKTYIDGKYVGINKVYYNSVDRGFYIFDDNNNNIYKNKTSMFAYSGKPNISQYNIVSNEITQSEINEIEKILDYSINNSKKISMDFNNDGINENLYIVNNKIMYEDSIKGKQTLIYNYKNKYIILDEEEYGYFIDSEINNIIDVFDDGKLEFIYTKTYFDQIGSCNILFRLKGNKFVKANECEIYN